MKFPSLREELFFSALRIRLVEERIIKLYPSDRIQSPVHLSIGQEAVAVGVCRSLTPKDLMFCTYRSHAFYLAKGGDLKAMFSELYGRANGCGGGKAGSMHLFAPEVGLLGTSAVVASTIPHAVGAALAAKRLGKEHVTVAVFGDGATDEGIYHESVNFAALHRLPVIFLCENNGLAVHSHRAARQAYALREHAEVYGLPTAYCAEGYDCLKVQKAFAAVVEKVRRKRSPHFVEVQTFRYKEHVGPGDDFNAGYRALKNLKQWQAKDPLIQERALFAKYAPVIEKEIDEAVAHAERSPFPGAERLLADVY